MQSGLYAIEIWSKSMFDPVSETISNFYVWGCPTYILETALYKPGVKIPKWYNRSRRRINMGFIKMHSTQVWLFQNIVNWFNFTKVSC